MRQHFRSATTFVLALLASAGMGFAQTNTASIQQTSATNATATQSQSGGLGNVAVAIQQNSSDIAGTQTQIGTNNRARLQQLNSSSGSTVKQKQNGNENVAKARQFAFQSSSIFQQQEGTSNKANADQAYRRNTKARQTQAGTGNTARITQRANFATANQKQDGDDNVAITRQLNKVRNVTAKTLQIGATDSRAVIVQKLMGDQGATINQNGCTGCTGRIDQ